MQDIGLMDRRIVIQSKEETQDGVGEMIPDWSNMATVWAQKMPKAGREFFAASQVVADIDEVFRIWYRTDLDNTMRISYGGKFYNILSILDSGDRQETLDLLAKAFVE